MILLFVESKMEQVKFILQHFQHKKPFDVKIRTEQSCVLRTSKPLCWNNNNSLSNVESEVYKTCPVLFRISFIAVRMVR